MKFPRIAVVVLAASFSAHALELGQTEYLPLNVGDEWTMDVMMTSAKGVIQKFKAHRKMMAEVVKDGKTYLCSTTWIEGGPLQHQRYDDFYRKDAKGLYSIVKDWKERKEQLEIPLPMKPSNSWKMEKNGIALIGSVVGFETVIIGERIYDKCIHIMTKTADDECRQDFWRFPRMGTVKSEIVYSDGFKITFNLQKFEPGR
jgi:hypothetical protein